MWRSLQIAAVRLGALADLSGELAVGVSTSARTRSVAVRASEALEQREHEGSGLAGAGLRRAQEVLTRCDGRDGFELDGSGGRVTFIGHRSEEGSGEGRDRRRRRVRCERLGLHDGGRADGRGRIREYSLFSDSVSRQFGDRAH